MALDMLFSPQSVAVVGASNRELTIGCRIIENLMDFGFTGSIHPVNPKGGEIRGHKAYASILDVPCAIDVAHIVIKNSLVPACVEDCAARGVKAVIVNTAGFREIGPDGAALEEQLVAIVARTGIRVFGPNCQGIINTDERIRAYCNFTFTRPTPGPISIIAQSGGVGEVIHQRITELGTGVRKYASTGNACDVSIPEIIDHYGQDEQTKVILVHIESLPDPRAFLDAATRVAIRKPILAIKAGRTAEGAKAVASHTGGLMTQDTAIELVFEKAGVVSFRNIEDLCQSAVAFASQPMPTGNRVGMITNTGGPAIIATDELIERGMVMGPLSKETEAILREKLYPEASVNNPVDVLATAGPNHFAAAIDALLDDDGIDAVFLNFVTPFFVDTVGIAHKIAEANRRSRKPIVATIMTEKKGWAETLGLIRESGVPVYDMPETAARALASMGRYAALQGRPADQPASFDETDTQQACSIIERAVQNNRTFLSAEHGFALLSCYGISVARYALAADVDRCLAAADEIGYPVVLKIDAESVVHKTDSGAIVLDIRDRDALRERAEELAGRFSMAVSGNCPSPTLRNTKDGAPGSGKDGAHTSLRFLVQEQLRQGHEVIVGAKASQGLGHIIMFGLGGIYVEVLGDVSFKIAPVSQSEVVEMIESVKAYRLLTDARGQQGVDLAALVDTIQRVSRMLTDNPRIRELDINPIFASHHGAQAADVRVMI